jgi:hypothetical protein
MIELRKSSMQLLARATNMFYYGTPYEIRTRVLAVKGRYPRPLDERCFTQPTKRLYYIRLIKSTLIGLGGENRTPASRFGGCRTTIILHRGLLLKTYYTTFFSYLVKYIFQ